jgi:small-conductance mechanosensitive channel
MVEITALVNQEHVAALVEGASRFGLQIIAAIAVFVVGRWLARRIADLLERGLVRAKTDPTLVSFFRNIAYFGLLIMVIIIPDAQVTNSTITNYSARDTRRLDLVFGVSYGDDLDTVKRVIGEVLAEEQRLLKDPEPVIGLLSLGDSSVNFAVRPWVSCSDYWPVFFDLQEAMKKRFDKEGISIPFPQRDVHLYQQAS